MDLGSAVGKILFQYDPSGVQQAKADVGALSGVTKGLGLAAAGASLGAMGAGILAPLEHAVGIASDVQKGLIGIQATTGATDQQIASLDKTVAELGQNTIFTAQDITGAASEMAKAGVSIEDVYGGALEAAANLAAASGEDITTSAGAITDAMNLFGISGEDAAQVADLVTQSVNSSAIGIGEYSAGFRNLGPIMANFANDQQEAIDLLGQTGEAVAFFTANGLKGADAGLSFGRMIQNLATPSTEEYADAIKAAGINLFDLNGNFVGTEEAIRQVNKAFAGLSDEQKTLLMDQLGIGQEALDVVGIIAAQGDEYGTFVDGMHEGNTAAEQAALQMKGLSGAVESFTGSLDEAFRQVGASLLAPLEGVVRAITEVVNAFIGAPDAVQNFIAVMTGAIGVALAITGAILGAAAALSFLGTAAGAVGISMGLLTAAAVAAGAAIGLGILAYQSNFMGFGDAVDNALANASKAIDTFGKRFSNAFDNRTAKGMNGLAAGISAFGAALKAAVGIDITDQMDALARATDAVGDAFIAATEGGFNPAAAALIALSAGAEKLGLDGFADGLMQAASNAQEFGDTFGAVFTAAQASGVNGISAALQGLGAAITDVTGVDATGFFNTLAGAVTALGDLIPQVAGAIKDGLGTALGFLANNILPGVISALGNTAGTIVDVFNALRDGDIAGAMQTVGDALGELGGFISDTLSTIGTGLTSIDWGGIATQVAGLIGNALSTIGSTVATFLTSIDWGAVLSTIGSTLLAAFTTISSFLTGVAGVVGNALIAALNTVGTFLSNIPWTDVLQTISDSLLQLFNTGGEWLGTVAATVGSALTNALNTVGNFIGGINFSAVLTTVADAIGAVFQTIGDHLPDVATNVGNAIGTVLATVADHLPDIDFSGVIAKVQEALNAAFNALTGAGGGPNPNEGEGGGATGFAQNLANNVKTAIEGAFNGLSFNLAELGTALQSAVEAACGIDLSGAFEALGTAVRGAINGISSLAAQIPGIVQQIASAFEGIDLSGAFAAIGAAVQGVIGQLSSLAAGVAGWIGQVQSAIQGLDIGEGFANLVSAARDVITQLSSIASGVGGWISTISSAIAGLNFDKVAEAVTAFGGIRTAVDTLIADLPGLISTLSSTLTGWVDAVVTKIGEIATALGNLKDSFSLTPDQTTVDSIDASLKAGTDKLGIPEADTSATASNFVVSYIGQIAEQFVQADWTPVGAAIQTGLTSFLSGGGTTGGPEQAGGVGIGATIAASLITDISNGLLQNAAALQEALSSVMSTIATGGSAGLGGEGAGAVIGRQIVTDIGMAFGQAAGELGSAINAALGVAFQTGLTGVTTTISTTTNQWITTISTTMRAMADAAIQGVGTMAQGVQAALTTVSTAISVATNQWISTIITSVSAMATSVASGFDAMLGAVTAEMGAITTAIATSSNTWITSVTTAGTAMASAMTTAMAAVTAAVQSGMDAAVSAVQAGVDAINAALASAADQANAAGVAVGQGFADGISSMQGAVEAAAGALASAAMSAINSVVQPGSPSKAAYDIAETIPQGLVAAMQDGLASVGEAGSELAKKIIDSLEGRFAAEDAARAQWLPTAQGEMSKRAQSESGDRAITSGEFTIHVPVTLDGERMADWTVKTTLGALTEVPQRGGRKASRLSLRGA